MSDELGGGGSNLPADGGAISDAGQASTPAVTSDVQAPQAKPSGSTREALEKAFASVDNGAEPAGKAAGVRDPMTGQFTKQAAAAGEAMPKPVAEGQKPAPDKALEAMPKPAAMAGQAPAGFTKAAQEGWAQTPEAVRADVERRMGELTQGMEKYKGDATAFAEVREFADLAKQTGTTLKEAMTNYVSIDKRLNGGDFVGGMAQIMQNIGMDPRQGVAALVNWLNQGGGAQQAPAAAAANPEVAALKAEIADLKKQITDEVGSVKQTLSQRESAQTVEKFAADKPHFDALANDIAEMLETGYAKNLSDAYEKAVRLNPEIAAKIEADKAPKTDPAAQTRVKAGLSITGTPSAGSNPATRKPAGSPREALENAFAQVAV